MSCRFVSHDGYKGSDSAPAHFLSARALSHAHTHTHTHTPDLVLSRKEHAHNVGQDRGALGQRALQHLSVSRAELAHLLLVLEQPPERRPLLGPLQLGQALLADGDLARGHMDWPGLPT